MAAVTFVEDGTRLEEIIKCAVDFNNKFPEVRLAMASGSKPPSLAS